MISAGVVFCTYFDSRYLARGLVLYESLRQHAPGFRLFVLCLDEATHNCLTKLALPGVIPIPLSEFEAGDDELLAAKSNRSTVEYYFTCTPSLPFYVLNNYPDLERIFYIDADFCFFSSVEPILAEMGKRSIYIVGHRYPSEVREPERWGKFNVGILGFRNDSEGRHCLETWRRQCISWCYDRVEGERFADQKYLDSWPTRYQKVLISEHPGINLAPWNRANYHLTNRNGHPCVDGQPIVCFHFHGITLTRWGIIRLQTNDFGKLSRHWINRVYKPYLLRLLAAERRAGMTLRHDLRGGEKSSLVHFLTHARGKQLLVAFRERMVEVPSVVLSLLHGLRRVVEIPLMLGRRFLRRLDRGGTSTKPSISRVSPQNRTLMQTVGQASACEPVTVKS